MSNRYQNSEGDRQPGEAGMRQPAPSLKNESARANTAGADHVNYRRARNWQVILVAFNAVNLMGVTMLITQASYAANLGFGISTLMVGSLLVFTRIFDAVTDPLLAFLYDRVNTRSGKIRPLLLLGWVIQSVGILSMFSWAAGKGFGVPMFLLTYMVYVIGYTIVNMTAKTIPPLMTNDPRQRPMLSGWNTALSYLTPMVFSLIFNVVLLPRYGAPASGGAGGFVMNYSLDYLEKAAMFTVFTSFAGLLLCCIGVSSFDKTENFIGMRPVRERLKIQDMWEVLRHNRPLQAYIVAASTDSFAQNTSNAVIVATMWSGILIGNMQLMTLLYMVWTVPSVLFVLLGSRYSAKQGNRRAIVLWARAGILASGLSILYFVVLRNTVGIRAIGIFGLPMLLLILLQFANTGSMMAGSAAGGAFLADIVDFELDRSGNYVPAVVAGTFSLVDKVVSSFSSLLTSGMVALVGYTQTVPQPGDMPTDGIFWVTMFLRYGVAILGWLFTLLAMRGCGLGKIEMAQIQKRIAQKKSELQAEQEGKREELKLPQK